METEESRDLEAEAAELEERERTLEARKRDLEAEKKALRAEAASLEGAEVKSKKPDKVTRGRAPEKAPLCINRKRINAGELANMQNTACGEYADNEYNIWWNMQMSR